MLRSQAKVSLSAAVALWAGLLAAPAGADPDRGPAAETRPTPTPPSVHLAPVAWLGWAREQPDMPWRRVSGVSAELTDVHTPGLVLGVHGLYQSSFRTYTPVATFGSVPALPAAEQETRIDAGVFVGWDPLHTWADQRTRRAGFVMLVTALDLDQFMSHLSPLVGFEPGAGARAFVRVLGPLSVRAGGTCQWVTNLSPRASTARLARGRPLGTLRYDAKAVLALTHFAELELGYAGESFAFEFESTQIHSLVLGAALDV
jgi:hypothetical protein